MRGWVTGYVQRSKRRRRRMAVAGIAAASVATLATAAWIIISPQQVQERWAFCYEDAALDAPHSEGVRHSGDELGNPAANALDMCATLWSAGILGGTAGVPVTGEPVHPVPDLALCVRADQALAVFPVGPASDTPTLITGPDATEFCSSLGLGVVADGD